MSETEHRGIIYSIDDSEKGIWRWTLHPSKTSLAATIGVREITRGQASSLDEAVEQAKKAIDRLLDG